MLFLKLSRSASLACLLLTVACSAPQFDARAMAMEWAAYMQRDYRPQPGDRISITILPDGISEQLRVPPSGKLMVSRLPQEVEVIGRSLSEIAQDLTKRYKGVYEGEFSVQIAILELAAPTVYIGGEVRSPGPVPYLAGMTLSQGVFSAGGLLITAKPSDVRVLRNVTGAKPRTIRVNLDEILYDASVDFLLLPGDVVFCQTSAAADVGNWVELYIRRMIPIPFSAFGL